MDISIPQHIVTKLSNGRNLLAFSGGVDSTALFHILLNHKIEFDIALVNYGIRKEAKDEEAFAKELAKKYYKKAHISYAPKWTKDFEANARKFRYSFFGELIDKEKYTNLITAHQLNDRVEWMMMRLIRGAGVSELAGMKEIESRVTPNSTKYHLIRPLLEISRDEIEEFLNANDIPYFIDSSNESTKYERNRFRKICNPIVNRYAKGISRSFEYLNQDRELIESLYKIIYQKERLFIIEYETKAVIDRACDTILKNMGYLMSQHERTLLKKGSSIVAGRKWAIEITNKYIFISPYITDIVMPKEFREECRVAQIPPKCRAYLYSINLEPSKIDNLSI